jgi:FkbM family methyltransferase
MKKLITNVLRAILKSFNIGVTTYTQLELLKEIKNESYNFLNLNKDKSLKVLALAEKSHAQLKQDLFVLHELDFKKNGFFIEFGATNGLDLSNTYLLEKDFNWDGILAEPARHWHSELKKNRECIIETDCVWSDSKTVVTFNETVLKEFSTIDTFSNSDNHKKLRKNGEKYPINTISLTDLLDKYNAPKVIDYLSIDTEGSEFAILSNFDFHKYSFRIITCEHNSTPSRNKIYQLLKAHGYVRKYAGFSKWDDWYINPSIT